MNANAIVAMLFAAGRSVTRAELARAAGCSGDEIARLVREIPATLESSPFQLVDGGDGYALVLRQEYLGYAQAFANIEQAGELTPAAAETLALIAYRGPVRRSILETIRGVHCAMALRILLQRDLIAEDVSDDAEDPLYSVSVTALRQLGLGEIQELPEYANYGPSVPFESLHDGKENTTTQVDV